MVEESVAETGSVVLELPVEPPDVALPESEEVPGTDELLTAKVLGSMVGMVLVTGLITQLIKVLWMRKKDADSIRRMAFIVSAVVVVISKLALDPRFSIADILIIPGNAIIVWLNSMKGYEITFGAAGTPAGKIS